MDFGCSLWNYPSLPDPIEVEHKEKKWQYKESGRFCQPTRDNIARKTGNFDNLSAKKIRVTGKIRTNGKSR
jgi:hypothetical protein